jgi:hypothetical protein
MHLNSVGLGPARAVFKAARLARDGRKKSQTLIVFVRVGRSFKKSEPGADLADSYPARRPTLHLNEATKRCLKYWRHFKSFFPSPSKINVILSRSFVRFTLGLCRLSNLMSYLEQEEEC